MSLSKKSWKRTLQEMFSRKDLLPHCWTIKLMALAQLTSPSSRRRSSRRPAWRFLLSTLSPCPFMCQQLPTRSRSNLPQLPSRLRPSTNSFRRPRASSSRPPPSSSRPPPSSSRPPPSSSRPPPSSSRPPPSSTNTQATCTMLQASNNRSPASSNRFPASSNRSPTSSRPPASNCRSPTSRSRLLAWTLHTCTRWRTSAASLKTLLRSSNNSRHFPTTWDLRLGPSYIPMNTSNSYVQLYVATRGV